MPNGVRIELTAEHEMLRAGFRAFAEEQVAPYAASIDRDQAFPAALVRRLAAAGYLASTVPALHGGCGLDPVAYGLLHAELGRVCASTRSLLTVHDMVAEAILRLGGKAMRAEWLPRLARGELVAAFALTEPQAGSDAGAIRTTAVEDGDEYVLHGCKRWISFGQLADVMLVLARIGDAGPQAGFLVPRDTPGLTVTPIHGLLGMRGSMLAELGLDGCRVPSSSRVGPAAMPAGLAAGVALQLGRYSVAWGCVGIVDACVDACLAHADERVQFGVAIGEHQLVRRMLTDMLTGLRTARLLCLEAGTLIARRDPAAVDTTLMAKYHASRTATRVTADAVQLHGALGASDALPLERHFRDARVMEIIEGSTQIQQLTIARHARRARSADTGAVP